MYQEVFNELMCRNKAFHWGLITWGQHTEQLIFFSEIIMCACVYSCYSFHKPFLCSKTLQNHSIYQLKMDDFCLDIELLKEWQFL